MKQTAIEFLISKLQWTYSQIDSFSQYVSEAKEMEKEQMLNSFYESRLTHSMIGFKHKTFLEYYEETFDK